MPKVFEGWLDKPLDRILALLGLFLALVLTIWLALTTDSPLYVTAGLLFALGCASYLLLRRRFSSSTVASLAQTEPKPQLYTVLNILFFALFSYSVISAHLRSELYSRPLGYFISVALMVAIVAVEIIFLPRGKFYSCFALLKIILIALSLEWSQLLIFPDVVGIDPWAHKWFTTELLSTRHIPDLAGWGYSRMPLFHLMTGETSLIAGLNYKIATMSSIVLLHIVCNIIFVFLLGRFLLSPKGGLLAALLLGVATNYVMFGYSPIPNTAAVILMLPIIYLLFKVRRDKPIMSVSLAMLLMATLILMHTVTAMCLAILLFVLWAGLEIYGRLNREKLTATVTLTIATLFSVAMFSWWTLVSGHIRTLADLIKVGFTEEYFVPGILVEETAQYMSGVPLFERLFNNFGMFLFFALSLIGCFYMISRRFGDRYSFATATGGVVLLALGFLPMAAGRSIIEERWHYFSQVMLAVPLAIALLLLCNALGKSNLVKASVVAITTFLLCFLMIMSPVANQDNHQFSPNTGARYAFTQSELQAADTVSKVWKGEIGADWYYGDVFRFELRFDEFSPIDDSLYTADFSERQDMLIMVRDEIREHPFNAGPGILKVEHDPGPALEEQGFSCVYSCGDVSAFINLYQASFA